MFLLLYPYIWRRDRIARQLFQLIIVPEFKKKNFANRFSKIFI
jgi:hypothetical protein